MLLRSLVICTFFLSGCYKQAHDSEAFAFHSATIVHPEDGKIRQVTTLPHHWKTPGLEKFEVDKYGYLDLVIEFSAPTTHTNDYAIWIPQVTSAAEIWLNDRKIEQAVAFSKDDRVKRQWNKPLFYPINEVLLSEGNRLRIRIYPKFYDFAMISKVHVGPSEILRGIHDYSYFKRIQLPLVSFIASLAFCLILSFFIAAKHRHEENAYLLATCIFWCIYSYEMFIEDALLPGRYWEALVFMSLGGFSTFMCLFFHRFHEEKKTYIERCLLSCFLFGSLVLFFIEERYFPSFTNYVWNSCLLILAFYQYLYIFNKAYTKPNLNNVLIVISGTILVASGINDNMEHLFSLSLVEDARLLPVAMSVHLFILSLVRSNLYLSVMRNYEELRESVDNRIQTESKKLLSDYEIRAAREKDKARLNERERILREVHDGMGSKITSTLIQLEKLEISPNLTTNLKEALNDMRLVLNASYACGGRLDFLLGSVREQVDRMLNNTGVSLDWKIQDTNMISHFTAEKELHVVRILQEAIGNCLKHAQASELKIRCYNAVDLDCVIVSCLNNGKPMRCQNTGHGLKNMKLRAKEIGARLRLVSQPNNVGIILEVPYERSTEQVSVNTVLP